MKVALVTGGNSGIGKHTVIGLLRKGYRVSMTSRNPERGREALEEIKRAADSDQVDCLRLDLGSFASIHTCADEVVARHGRLDLLVNNAGLVLSERRETAEGFEMTFGVNHIGHFLLTSLLRETLVSSGPSRVVNLASDAHRLRGALDFDDLQARKSYDTWTAYAHSKLANVLFTRELARRLEGTNVTTYSVHPGVVRSGFGRDGDLQGVTGFLIGVARPFMISEEKGARTSLYVATAPVDELQSGGYYAKCTLAKPSRAARDDEAARRLWDVTERLVLEAEAGRETQVDEE